MQYHRASEAEEDRYVSPEQPEEEEERRVAEVEGEASERRPIRGAGPAVR